MTESIAVHVPPAASSPDMPATMHAQGRDQAVGLYPWYVLGVLFLVYVLNFIDRNILSILAPAIKASLHIGDAQIGFLYGTAFAIFYALFGIPLGRLADGWYRVRLIAAGLVVWSVMTTLSGFAGSYGQLAVGRAGVGVGEASASPAAYSLLADYFPVRRRGLAISIYSAGLFVGAGLALPLGGWISHSWSSAYAHSPAPLGLAGWQAAFLAVGPPGLLLALWLLTLREPQRGQADGHTAPVVKSGVWRDFARELGAIVPPFTFWSVSRFPGALRVNLLLLAAIASVAALLLRVSGHGTADAAQWIGVGVGWYAVASWVQMLRNTDRPTYALVFANRAVVLALFGLGAMAFVNYSVGYWIPIYVIRTFSVRPDVAGLMLGVPFAFAAAAGCVVGGYWSDAWNRRDPRGRLFVCMLASVPQVPLLIAALHASNVGFIYAVNPLLGFITFLWLGSGVAAIQDCVLPRMRATAGAIFLLAVTMLGLALGPYACGKLSDLTGSLGTAMSSMLVMVPVAVILLWLSSREIGAAQENRVARAKAAGEPV